MREKYIKKLCETLQKNNIDAMLICPSAEMKFFAGFTVKLCERFQGMFIKADGDVFYITNLLTEGELKDSFGGEVPVYSWFDGDNMIQKVGDILKEKGLVGKTIAVNSSAQAFNILDLAQKVGINFINGKPILEEARIIKDEEELENLRKSAAIADQSFSYIIKNIRPGMTEADVQKALADEMVRLGGTEPWVMVCSGPGSSYPHYARNDRVITEKDIIVLDFGCTYNEMCSDMTRTIFVGGATEEEIKVYNIVRHANEAAEAIAKPGTMIPVIDKTARDIIAEAGYGETFTTRLGHGIGYMVHEAPDIKQSNIRALENGMAFSVEPGIYMAGNFGVRIEDIVVINLKGETEILNKTTKDIIII